jgi:orotate phosphoribosyltransferase-like protein
LSTKSDQLEWRRSKVVEMRARGMTHGEIAHELQVSRTSITSDIAYLRNQAKESIKECVYRTLSRATCFHRRGARTKPSTCKA